MTRKMVVAACAAAIVITALVLVLRTGGGSSEMVRRQTESTDSALDTGRAADLSGAEPAQTTYYETGERKSSGPTVDGLPHGRWMGWYPNGSVAWEGPWLTERGTACSSSTIATGRSPSDSLLRMARRFVGRTEQASMGSTSFRSCSGG